VTTDPLWGNAQPLAGCEVIRPTGAAPKAERAVKTGRPAVVAKILALNRFLDATARTLQPSAALVWLQLLRDERNGTARTAVTDLARRCGLSARTVKRRLAELKACGLVTVVRQGRRDVGPTAYRLSPTPRRP
jgi:DNA-binding transcriptional ArsR family regulator